MRSTDKQVIWSTWMWCQRFTPPSLWKRKFPRKWLINYKLQALRQYFLLLLAKVKSAGKWQFFPIVLKVLYWIFLGWLRVLKDFLLILDFDRWTTGTPLPTKGRNEYKYSSPLFLSERYFGSLEDVKKLCEHKGFHQRKTKSFQLAFPGFQRVAFCFLKLVIINKWKKQFSFSISLKLIKTLLEKKRVYWMWGG